MIKQGHNQCTICSQNYDVVNETAENIKVFSCGVGKESLCSTCDKVVNIAIFPPISNTIFSYFIEYM